jgi:hypothetical protein
MRTGRKPSVFGHRSCYLLTLPYPEANMDKVSLDLDDLTVESFSTYSDGPIIIGGDCTGCDSGCGIAGPIYSHHYC